MKYSSNCLSKNSCFFSTFVPPGREVKKQQIIFQQAGALRASDLDDLISQAKALDMDAAASDGDTASSGDAKVKTPSSQSER